MKVLVVSNMYPGRNKKFEYAGIFVKEQVEALNRQSGVECNLFIINGYKSKLAYFWGSIKLLVHLAFNKYDVIHAHYGLSALFTLLNPFKRRWDNVILTLHGGDILVEQGKNVQVFLTKLILNRVAKVLTLNDKMNDVVGTYRDDYIVLPCGVDTDFFKPDFDVIRGNTILFPGRTDREVKNFPLFQKVISNYNEKFGHLEIVPLDGFTREEVKAYMQTAAAVLMTSVSEGSPQVIKEAMSCDMAIVSSNVGDVEYLTRNVAGAAVFNLDDEPADISELLHETITQAKNNLGARRDKIMALDLSNDCVVNKLIRLYEEVKGNVK
ncbi:glycosyltransferase [Motilimonas sp. KMU-193]|uniref:glycosyltransferase n=1 Tax=Motilimonas sp. KMU-193 TaxID=3388668 RepID=UPI00396B2630